MKVMVTSNDTGIVVHGMTTLQRRLQYGATLIQNAWPHPFKIQVIFGPNILGPVSLSNLLLEFGKLEFFLHHFAYDI